MNTIASCQTLQDKAVIPAITVTIDKQWDPPAPVGTRGSLLTKYQVSDATGNARLSMFTSAAPTLMVGQQITLQSTPGRNGQLGGVEANIYNGKFSLKVSDQASVIPLGAGQPAAAQPEENPFNQQPAVGTHAYPQADAIPTSYPQAASVAQAPVVAATSGIDTQAVAMAMSAEWALVYLCYKASLMKNGVPEAEAIEAAKFGPGLSQTGWFGKKSLSNPDGE